MVKGNPKSSASSATRKKHAAKKTATPDEPPPPTQKRPKTKVDRKLSKKVPRVKMYIPPVKPAPVQPDPLETTGLSRTLPADLLIVLRNISKKAQVTKIRALEELQTGWVEKCMKDKEACTLVEMLPVWLHHVSALFLHPSRRVRFLAVSLHASLLRISAVRDQILLFLRGTAFPSQTESILGAWSLAAHDVDRAVSTTALKAWKEIILSPSEVKEGSSSSGEQLVLDDEFLSSIGAFVQRTALDPSGIYAYLNPPPHIPTVNTFPPEKKRQPGGKLSAMATPRKDDSGTQTPRSKVDEQEEGEQDRKARLRISAFGATRWIFGTTSSLSEDFLAFSSNPALWTALHPNESCPWIDGFESFGFAQPNVRKAAWGLVQALLNTEKGQLETIVPILGNAILRSAWVELDSTVQGVMWQPLLMFLKQFSHSWTLDDTRGGDEGDADSGSEAENDDEPQYSMKAAIPPSLPQKQSSQAYLEFLQFLQLGCSGSPLQGYPTVVITLSTIPSSVMASSTITSATSSPISEFFTSFWAAVDGRALSSLHRSATSAAFLSSLLECMVFLIKRMKSNPSRHPDPDQASTTATTSDLGGLSLSISEAIRGLVKAQYTHIWNELVSKRLKVEERAAARLLGMTMEKLAVIDHALMDVAWEAFVDGVRRGGVDDVLRQHRPGQQDETTASKSLISAMLKVFYDRFKDGTVLKKRVVKLVKDVLDAQLERFLGVERLEGEKFGLLVSFLDQFREGLFFDEEFTSRLDDLLAQHAFLVLDLSPSLLLSYLLYRKSEERCLVVWHSLLSSVASTVTVSASKEESIPIVRLLDAARQGQLPSYLKPKGGELDVLVGGLLEKALTGPVGSDEVGLVRQILTTSDYFISKSGYSTILQIIIATFGSHVKQVMDGKEVRPALFEVAIDFVGTIFGKLSSSLSEAEEGETLLRSLLPDIFFFGYLLPLCDRTVDSEDLEGSSGVSHSHMAAKSLWEGWIKVAKEGVKEEVVGVIKMRLKMSVEDTHIHPLPEHALVMLSRSPPGIHVDLLHDIFPSATQLDSMLDDLSPDAIDPSVAVLNPLIPPQPHSNTSEGKQETDRRGFTAYARIVNALLQVFIEDRQLAKRSLWVLRHFLALSVYAQDLRNVPSPTSSSFSSKHDLNNYSPVFDHEIMTMSALRDVVSRVKQVSVYLLGSAVGQDDDGSWRKGVLGKLLKDVPGIETPKEGVSQLQQFLWDVITYAKEEDKLRDTRVLKIVLESVFSDGVDVGEADLWIQLVRKLEGTAPQTSMTIIAAITATGAEPPRLDRYRNEIAASLLGIKSHKSNTEGWLALRKLAASAPDPDGDVVFLTSPRAINVIKACQGWVLAADGDNGDGDEEEEMEERVESAMLPIFMHLAPILQNVPGGHWAFVFDVLEGVLERASSADKTQEEEEDEEEEAGEMGEGLVALARALRLVIVLEELATRNKSLMAEWEGRRMGVLIVIRDLSILRFDSADVSTVPCSTCRELVLSIVQHLPSSLIDQDTLPKMCHLIQDTSPTVQKKAYQLLQEAAKKRTEYFVIETAVDTEGVVQAELPIELMAIVQRDMNFVFGFGLDEGMGGGDGGERGGEGEKTAKEEDQNHHVFGYLLAWMLVFDLFQDASFKVKSNYIDQLKNHDVVVGHLIPCFLNLFRLDQGSMLKVFKLDVWGVDEFYIDLYEPGNPHTITVLAAHLYYRALLTIPSLIHSWVQDCKDRQLTKVVTDYTSTYFSPVIIRAELEHVRTHSTASSTGNNSSSIADENMSVKVAQAINEVAAAYSVDEHQLEIKLRIPVDWPLHRIEVKDVKMVGVEEKRWRAWVLGVQQTMYAHNGRIVDGLSLFKKNVTLHFEGQVECAICYSIISVMDGSLPKKPCKTCKNRFHAGCLYKWFNSSHSSSCPLCRSDIM